MHKLQIALVCDWFLKAMNGVKKLRCNWQSISDFILFPVLFLWTVFQTFDQSVSVLRMLAHFCLKCWLCVNLGLEFNDS